VVRKTSTGWEICADQQEVLSWNRELEEYAQQNAKIVTLDRTDGTGWNNGGMQFWAVRVAGYRGAQ
jgi:hypothetical protein